MNFIDLFAGVGGFRLGFEKIGFNCVFSSEIDEDCQQVYKSNFGDKPYGDIFEVDIHKDIPQFDILVGGFPCQPFSVSGKRQGFHDTRGTLFFRICEILEARQPKIVVLENVKHLIYHDKKRTFKIILNSLRELGYYIDYRIYNAKDFGVPQNRERVIIVGKHKDYYNGTINFQEIDDEIKRKNKPKLREFLDEIGDFEILEKDEYTIIDNPKLQNSGLIFTGYRNKNIWKKGIRPNTEHLSRVHRQPNRIYSIDGVHPTLSAQETSGRYFIYIPEEGIVRKLTIDECYRIMGFPDKFIKSERRTEAYKQIGNSVAIPLIRRIAEQIFKEEKRGGETMDYSGKLEEIYKQAYTIDESLIDIPLNYKMYLQTIGSNSKRLKAVYTVFVTLAVYKIFHPEQDIRYHRTELENGFSGRSFDTKYITPTLKRLGLPAMNESGWLTRSLEQPYPYTLDYGGKISNKLVKEAFLYSIDYIQDNPSKVEDVLKVVLNKVIEVQNQNKIKIVPLKNPETLTITKILKGLDMHFNFNYKTSGGSKLPVLAFQSIYQIFVKEFNRYKDCELKKLGSHTASDRTSKAAGDIEVLKDGKVFEAIEIKLDRHIDDLVVRNAIEKIYKHNPQRYYILSTKKISTLEKEKIEVLVNKVKKEHGCQIVTNGVMDTIKYYLRTINNLEEFIFNYSNLIEKDKELKKIHKDKWNQILDAI